MPPAKRKGALIQTMPKSFRFTKLFVKLLDKLAEEEGLTQTAYLETTIRTIARNRGWNLEEIGQELKQETDEQAG